MAWGLHLGGQYGPEHEKPVHEIELLSLVSGDYEKPTTVGSCGAIGAGNGL